jgi:Flp pilus assembly protein protease CpaA
MMWVFTLHDQAVPAVQWGTVFGASLLAAIIDARTRHIPNVLTGALLLGGLVHAVLVAGAWGLLDAAAATIVLALPYVILFAWAKGGAGDAKMMGALGSWLGLVNGLAVLFAVCACGVVMALIWAAVARRLSHVAGGVSLLARGVIHPFFGAGSLRDVPALLPPAATCQTMPYGPAISAGVLIAAASAPLWSP